MLDAVQCFAFLQHRIVYEVNSFWFHGAPFVSYERQDINELLIDESPNRYWDHPGSFGQFLRSLCKLESHRAWLSPLRLSLGECGSRFPKSHSNPDAACGK